jgi:hypothetical protein
MQILSAYFPTRLRGPATALAALSMSLFAAMPTYAATIFSDNFDTGATAAAQNAASWQAPTSTVAVTKSTAASGCCSLGFTYGGSAIGGQGMAQATLAVPQRTTYWFQYKLFVPSNYYHRNNDGASNNKFLAVYAMPYSNPGFQINLSTEPNGSGGSNLDVHYYNNGSEQTPVAAATNFIGSGDLGKWMSLVIQVAVPSGSSSQNGIVNVWKNGQQVVNITNLASYGGASNFINEVYFLGWANSGFTATTVLNIDDLVVADTPLTGTSTGTSTPPPTSTVVPDPPSSVSVQ